MYCGVFNVAVAFIVKWSLFLSETTCQDILLRVLGMELNIRYVAHVCKSVVFLKGFENHDQCGSRPNSLLLIIVIRLCVDPGTCADSLAMRRHCR